MDGYSPAASQHLEKLRTARSPAEYDRLVRAALRDGTDEDQQRLAAAGITFPEGHRSE